MKEEIKPSYYNNFKCSGAECLLNCCRNWRIAIDKNTIEKYSKLKDDYSSYILENISARNECLILDRGFCPFLDNDGLCKIQKRYGENYLSEVCKNFPRKNVTLENFVFKDLFLSCPEVVKKILNEKFLCYTINNSKNNFINSFFKKFEKANFYKTNFILFNVLDKSENINVLKTITKKDISKVLKTYKIKTNFEIVYNNLLETENILKNAKFSNEEANITSNLINISEVENFKKNYFSFLKKIKNINFKNLSKYFFINLLASNNKNSSKIFVLMSNLYHLLMFKHLYFNKQISNNDIYKIISSLSRAVEHSQMLKEIDFSSELFMENNITNFLQTKY